MMVIDLDIADEDDLILKLDDVYTRCERILSEFENDDRIRKEMVGREIVKLMAQQTDLIIKYTMIIPEICAMGKMVDAYLKKTAAIMQKNLNASSQKALGEREVMRLIDGDPKMLKWLQHKAQLEQFEGNFKAIQQLLVSRGFILKSIIEAHIHEKSDVVI